MAIIGRQVQTRSGPLDLLGIDKSGNVVVVELKRNRLPREVLAQAIDYASDIANWSIDKLSEVCTDYTGKTLEDFLSEAFEDISIEGVTINQEQRILMVGFRVEESLERMITWLSDGYSVSINAIVLNYVRTHRGDELLVKTTTIPEELAQARTNKKKFTIAMPDEPGNYPEDELQELLRRYFDQELKSAQRIRNVLIPECLKKGVVTRSVLKQAFIDYNEPNAEKNAGYFMSLISNQVGMQKNDFLRQIIGYDYPNFSWEKDNYRIREEHVELVRSLLEEGTKPGLDMDSRVKGSFSVCRTWLVVV